MGAVHGQHAAKHGGHSLADGQPQAGAAVFCVDAGVRLGEAVKYPRGLFFAHANACVLNVHH